MSDISIKKGIPTNVGVYVAYVDSLLGFPHCEKILLMWINNRWGYLGSDQNYRAKVYGWIGPLPPLRIDEDE